MPWEELMQDDELTPAEAIAAAALIGAICPDYYEGVDETPFTIHSRPRKYVESRVVKSLPLENR